MARPHLGFDAANAKARVYGAGENKISFIARDDVAEFAVRVLETPAAENAAFDLGGPEAVSPHEVIRVFEEAGGRPFEVQYVHESSLEAAMAGATDSLQRAFAALSLGYARGDAIPMEDTLRQFPIRLRSVRDYARDVIGRSAEAISSRPAARLGSAGPPPEPQSRHPRLHSVDTGSPTGRAMRDRVVEKLGFQAAPPPDLDGLRALYAAWCARVPFDNVRKMIALRTPGAPLPGTTAEDFFEGWLRDGAGGTCWPSSQALWALLSALGFEARRVVASMRDTGYGSHGTVKVRSRTPTGWSIPRR